MQVQSYPVERLGPDLVFFFESINPVSGKSIFKVVTYIPIKRYGKRYVNLGFGDFDDKVDNLFDDRVTSNNGDMRKILATVVSTMGIFFEEHPDKIIHVRGSDRIRNQYYQKLVSSYGDQIAEMYEVQGGKQGRIEDFQAGNEYEFLLIKPKKQ